MGFFHLYDCENFPITNCSNNGIVTTIVFSGKFTPENIPLCISMLKQYKNCVFLVLDSVDYNLFELDCIDSILAETDIVCIRTSSALRVSPKNSILRNSSLLEPTEVWV